MHKIEIYATINILPQKAINEISFKVNTGESIAFVGPSGSGKTTLMKLLVGLYRPQQGRILYNNIDENNIDFDDLRNQIGFVTQDTQLFSEHNFYSQ